MEEFTKQGTVHNYGVEVLNSSFICHERYWFENLAEALKFRRSLLVENGGSVEPAFTRVIYVMV